MVELAALVLLIVFWSKTWRVLVGLLGIGLAIFAGQFLVAAVLLASDHAAL